MIRWGAWLWLCALPIFTLVRVPVWGSEHALWLDASRKAPAKVRPVVNLGNVYAERGEIEIASAYYERAIALAEHPGRPNYERDTGWAVAAVNLAQMERAIGRHENALALLATVRVRFPKFREAERLEALWRSGS